MPGLADGRVLLVAVGASPAATAAAAATAGESCECQQKSWPGAVLQAASLAAIQLTQHDVCVGGCCSR
jgi:hypothetical protein